MFIVYILQSKKDLSFYIGFTSDIKRRLSEHEKGFSDSTKHKRPWVLVYCEVYKDRKDAAEREQKLKDHKNAWLRLKERIKHSILSG